MGALGVAPPASAAAPPASASAAPASASAGSPVDASRDAADASRVDALATAAELFVPVRARWNVNATVDNARAAAHLAAAALKPDPLTLFPVDETTGRERFDQPPLGVAPMKRRLTRPRGVLGAYDILSRADEAEDDRLTDAEPEPPAEGVGESIERASGRPSIVDLRRLSHDELLAAAANTAQPLASSRSAVDSIPAPDRTREAAMAALVREASPADAARDAATLYERQVNDQRLQLQRLRARRTKLGLVEKERRADEKTLRRGGRRGGRGARGGGRGRGPAAGTKRRTSHARADPDPYVWGFGSARKKRRGAREDADATTNEDSSGRGSKPNPKPKPNGKAAADDGLGDDDSEEGEAGDLGGGGSDATGDGDADESGSERAEKHP